MNPLTARVIVYAVIVLLISYDMVAVIRHWSTISEQIRVINNQTGWLFAWCLVALWMHWFFADLWLFLRGG